MIGQVKQQQHRVLQTLEVKRIPFETKDIAVDQEAKREFRRLMRIHDARAPTPQIFNGDTLCGVSSVRVYVLEQSRRQARACERSPKMSLSRDLETDW